MNKNRGLCDRCPYMGEESRCKISLCITYGNVVMCGNIDKDNNFKITASGKKMLLERNL